MTQLDFETYGTIYQPRGLRVTQADVRGDKSVAYPFVGRIEAGGEFPPESGRYHLYASYACPFAHRALLVRALKGLEEAISVTIVDPMRDGRGWAFRDEPDGGGGGYELLSEVYEASQKDYTGRVSVPVLFDKKTQRVVANYYPTITLDLGREFNRWARFPELDLYPERLRAEIDSLNDFIAYGVNEGVYRAGFALTQEEYEKAAREVFTALDVLEERLERGPYLFGQTLTEADIRLWVSLVRFDSVYHGHFKVNLRRLTEYPRLWTYTRRLYQIPAFRETTNFDHIKRHYYGTQRHINPRGLVPLGPLLTWDL